MKTAYTEYRVVLRDAHGGEQCHGFDTNGEGAQWYADALTSRGLVAYVETRDVSEWRRAEQ